MRWGKSWVGINFASAMYLKHDVRRVLVVTVTSALGVWEDQVVAHCPVPYRVYSHDGELLQESRKRPGRYQPPLTFMTVNYQNTFWHGMTGVGLEWVPIPNDVLVKFKPQIVIVDESHHIGDPTAITSHKIYALAQGAQYRVFMTGTMFHRKPFYVFGQIKFFDDGATFGGAWTHFKNKIAIFGGYGGYEVKGYRNMKWMMDKIRPMVFMQKYVPPRPRVKNVLHFPLTGKGLEVYKEMEKQRAIRVKGEIVTAEIVLTLHLRLMQIAGGFIKLPSGKYAQVGNDKIRMAEDRLREYLEQDITKAVVACRFTPELRALARLAKKLKFEPILFHGAVPAGDERKRRIAQFHSTKKPALFISQISAGKEGIDLSCASTTMWYSITESYVEFDQFGKRIELFKDKRTLMDDFLVAKGTRDETALKAMELKMDVADYLMDNPDKVDTLLNNGKPSRRR